MNKMNDKERMALSFSSSVKVTAGVWDAETQTWFGSRTKHPLRERLCCEAETVDGEVYTCLHHAPLYELVLERVCRVGVIAGKEGEKLKLAVGIQ